MNAANAPFWYKNWDMLVEKAKKMKVGDPQNPTTKMGARDYLSYLVRVKMSRSFVGSSRIRKLGFLIKTLRR